MTPLIAFDLSPNQHKPLKQHVYIFDAVGTVLRPVPGVIDAYFEAGKRHGSHLSKDQISQRFRDARRKHFELEQPASETVSGSLISSDKIEFQLWNRLVRDVFSDVDRVDALFSDLWEHFACPSNWQLYDDVQACWQRIAQRGDRIVIASNFDSRLNQIVAQWQPFSMIEQCFCSAEVGFRKPDPAFYLHIANRCQIDPAQGVTMIGDDFQNDYLAPKKFGWSALYLNRNERPDVDSKVDSIRSLTQI